MEYKIQDNILCKRQDSFGLVQGTIVKVLDDCSYYPDYHYIIQIISFSGAPVEDEYMWVNKNNIIEMHPYYTDEIVESSYSEPSPLSGYYKPRFDVDENGNVICKK